MVWAKSPLLNQKERSTLERRLSAPTNKGERMKIDADNLLREINVSSDRPITIVLDSNRFVPWRVTSGDYSCDAETLEAAITGYLSIYAREVAGHLRSKDGE